MRHGPNNREFVHHGGEPGQMLADANSRHRGRDFVELAANIGRRIRLEIKRIELAGTAAEKQLDDGRIRRRICWGRCGERCRRKRSASVTPPNASEPMRSTLRRLTRSQFRNDRPHISSMG